MTEDLRKLKRVGRCWVDAAIRKRRQWVPGTRLSVEETPEGVLLKPAPAFPRTVPEQVFGCLHYQGEPKTLDEMRSGIAAGARRRHARGRY